VWTDTVNGQPHVFARRSNKAATKFGDAVDAGRPGGASSAYRLDASATGTSLDVFGVFSIGTTPGAQTFYTRVLPGLTLEADRHQIHGDHSNTITFTVRAAGDPVSGAKVKAAGHSDTTDKKGHAKLALSPSGKSVTVTATANGYEDAKLKLKVV
jgi:hypothetical protein